ncbi:hypothetical protein SteCoe_4084 [Stentor coeruleus]|uniref:GAR domain-containing protein n=1 Tax=Stentor coeruleus TaxID=5963 RepID=A0A1R2CVJ9_9CILI|nr:hypothetical protein SteCoe_4084 [Stentor coeruleus]
MFQISIIRADGLTDNAEYSFYLEGKPLKQQQNCSEPTFIITKAGFLNIVLKDQKKKGPLFSVGLHTKLLPNEGFQWIPIFSHTQTIEELPEDVSGTKILIMVSNEFLEQIDEASESECDNCEALKQEKNRMHQELIKVTKEAKVSLDTFTAENEKNKVLMKKYQSLYTETKKEIDIYKLRYEEEKRKNQDLSEKIKSITYQLEDNIQKAKMREEFLENIINDREKEYNKFNIGETSIKKNQVRSESERSMIITPGLIMTPSRSLVQTIDTSLSNTSNSNNSAIQKDVVNNGRTTSKRRVLAELTSIPQSTPQETHSALRTFLKKTHRTGLFIRDSGNLYKFGKKKVYIALKHGNLLCRIGGGFENIEEFISKNSDGKTQISENIHRRNKTSEEVQQCNEELDLATSMYLRSSPEIEKLIRLRKRPSSNCVTE